MNIANRLAHITLLVAAVAAAFMLQNAQAADGTAQASTRASAQKAVRVVELPRVTVVAHRKAAEASPVRIVELPRVVIVARRLVPSDTLVAQRASRAAGV